MTLRGNDDSGPSWDEGEGDDGDEDDADGDPRWVASDPSEDADGEVTTLLFTATNPPGTVSASAVMDGRIVRIDLSPEVVRLTEPQLAEEITVIATMARRQAQAAQHSIAARVMEELGHDGASTRSYLERVLMLPSPQTVRAEKSSILASRYTDGHG